MLEKTYRQRKSRNKDRTIKHAHVEGYEEDVMELLGKFRKEIPKMNHVKTVTSAISLRFIGCITPTKQKLKSTEIDKGSELQEKNLLYRDKPNRSIRNHARILSLEQVGPRTSLTLKK